MTDLQMWSFISGAVLPLVVALIQRTGWGDAARAAVGFVAALVVASVEVYLTGNMGVLPWVTSVLLVLTSAITTYKGFWHKLGITDTIEGWTN